MARYTSSLIVAIPFESLHPVLGEMMQACNCEVIYKTDTGDYMMGRELPGKVPFAKLVTVEALIDLTSAKEVRIKLVVKNEELPLQVNNHCRQVFDDIQKAVTENSQWQILENVVG
ncbi:MAG: hypothetical protein KME17_27210 [Cyanosarcina radialis HA8281-LM2]|jgi:hypothetical protein|nr:hypothetical protein [Cyanosarcina radialis HA8281-LM2]